MKFDYVFAEGNKTVVDVYKMNEELDKLLDENGVWCEVVVYPNKIEIEKHWGDWKHDHLRLKYLVGEYLIQNGIEYEHNEVVTEEDGSDCYSAIHYFYFK